MMSSTSGFSLLLAAVSLEAVGQTLLKYSTDKVRVGDPAHKAVKRILKRWPRLYLGLACMVAEACFWTLALRRLPLSMAFPAASLSLVGITILSRWWLKESLTLRRWLGVAVIVTGVLLL